ncbi:MAG: hypothetical protein H7Y12_11025, partial [Sphingobacteriaceae bacterium]|nr:hypothetical protein [Cytophagaceae bacterium]
MEKVNSSGVVRTAGDVIKWTYKGELLLSIDMNEVVVIGEYTNDAGPWRDDWFLVFVTKSGSWQSIPRYADGIDE